MPFLVLGSGRFGRHAVDYLTALTSRSLVTVVDSDSTRLPPTTDRVRPVVAEAIDFLVRLPDEKKANEVKAALPEWIIPAVPIHVAYLWLARTLTPEISCQPLPIPQNFVTGLPGASLGPLGVLYASWSKTLCPEDCSGPAVCPASRRSHPHPLDALWARVAPLGWRTIVIRSHQLGPGVGGIQFRDLLAAQAELRQTEGPLMLATSCRCHGVGQAVLAKPVPNRSDTGNPTRMEA